MVVFGNTRSSALAERPRDSSQVLDVSE